MATLPKRILFVGTVVPDGPFFRNAEDSVPYGAVADRRIIFDHAAGGAFCGAKWKNIPTSVVVQIAQQEVKNFI